MTPRAYGKDHHILTTANAGTHEPDYGMYSVWQLGLYISGLVVPIYRITPDGGKC